MLLSKLLLCFLSKYKDILYQTTIGSEHTSSRTTMGKYCVSALDILVLHTVNLFLHCLYAATLVFMVWLSSVTSYCVVIVVLVLKFTYYSVFKCCPCYLFRVGLYAMGQTFVL